MPTAPPTHASTPAAPDPDSPVLDASSNHPRFTTTTREYTQELYRQTIGEDEIGEFLRKCDAYDCDENRWSIPTAPTKTNDLVSSVFKVLLSIVQQFVQPADSGVERELVNTQDISACEGKNEKGYRICPVMVVRAAGPSFEIPKPRKTSEALQSPSMSIGFGALATFFIVKLESELGDENENSEEMESYARRILYSQPNRFHVRSLVITEKHARLFHFDRSGSQIGPLFDIHDDPATFIRLVAGLSSVNEHLLGIDDSIQWTIVNGRKDKGTLTTTDANGDTKVYPIIEEIPIPRDSIRGRATTCWRVKDPDTSEELVVKDLWRPDNRPAEHELLELVKEVPGIVQMVSYETARHETKAMRCPSTTGQYQNRVFERVTMKAYGGPIESFKTVLQLLCAIRDAVAGHQRLVDENIRILHRDISPHNILLGCEGAPEGERGVLIDLDMAFRATDARPTATADYNIGTRIFQSLSVLNSHDHRQGIRAHDYLDDLESFFYLLVYIFLRFRPDGSAVPNQEEGPSIVREWADDCPSTANGRKNLILSPGRVGARSLRVVEGTWGTVCGALFKGFRRWVTQVRSTKTALLYKGSRAGDPTPLSGLHSQRAGHYCEVLTLFDHAIEAINATTDSPSAVEEPALAAIAESIVPDTAVSKDDTAEGPQPTTPPNTLGDEPIRTPPTPPLLTPTPPSAPLPVIPPATPPRHVQSSFSAPTSPPTPNRKRRSEDAVHPESPQSKARRVNGGPFIAARSP